ncbi:helix-turn-helix domain-containing protein [Pseudomonas frederiksbergensis]|uniref:helix-turn-helix domain-containing protein n=1 Tax=Pseudomonas frederiksbergensis TaxID=104087 RepID=UPI001114FA3F|nr:helix-turn-helix domain-containing protein [Pseudomonas frederiksbergensis]
MAKKLTRSEICEQESITMGVLRGIAARYAIEFTAGPKKAFAPNKTALESDALLVTQVKDCIAKGMNRTRCCAALGISSTLLYRLIKDYDIDYPKLEPTFR